MYKISDKGANAKCKKCQNLIFIKKHDENLNNISVLSPLASNVNTSNRSSTQQSKTEKITEESRDILCPKCGQRQPRSRDKCFKCGYDFQKLKTKTGEPPPIPLQNIYGIPIHKLKDTKVVISFLVVVSLLFFLGLYSIISAIFPHMPELRQIVRMPGTAPPIVVNDDSFTSVQYNKNFAAWQKKWLSENYRIFGKHSVTWDLKVKNIFDKYAIYCLGLSDDLFCSELLENIQEVVDLGYNDAIMTYILGNLAQRVYGAKYAEIPIAKSLNGLEQGGYPALYCYYAARRLILIYEKLGYDDEEVYDLLFERKIEISRSSYNWKIFPSINTGRSIKLWRYRR